MTHYMVNLGMNRAPLCARDINRLNRADALALFGTELCVKEGNA